LFTRLLDYLYGYERLRHRGDRLFLLGEFERARTEYGRARAVLREGDHRATTIEALLRECDALAGLRASSGMVHSVVARDVLDVSVEDVADNREEGGFHPGIDDLFELAIADKPQGRIDAYRVLGDNFKAGYVALVHGNAERAVSFLAASKEASSSFVVNLELGRAWSLAGHMDDAREALKLAERSAPSDVEVSMLLSAVNIELGRFDEAHERLEVLARDESDPDITFLLGRSLAGAKKNDAALEKFRETVKLEPRFHEAFFEAADVLRGRGDSEAAFELLNRACHLAPEEIRYNQELVELVLSDGHDWEAGLAACDRLMVNDEDNAWQYLKWIAELYIRRGFIREARDPLEKALNLVPCDRVMERMEIERCLASLTPDP